MFLLYFLILVFCIVVGMMLYYVLKQPVPGNPCPEDQPCNKPNPKRRCNQCRQPTPQCYCYKPNLKRSCNQCGQPKLQCNCHKPCQSC